MADTFFDEYDKVAESSQGTSILSKPGGDCKALYQKVDDENLYIRLELYDPVSIDIQYIFLINIVLSEKEKPIYQVFCVPGRVDFFKYAGKKEEKLANDAVKASIELGKKNVDIELNYKKLRIPKLAMQNAVTQVIVEELGKGKVVKSDKGQFAKD